jgi:hypothetical protein
MPSEPEVVIPTKVDGRLLELLGGLAVTMVEMEQGLRSVSTLDEHASPAARRRIRAVVRASGRRKGRDRRGRRTAPTRVLRTTAFYPSAGAVEGAVLVDEAGRVRAFAIRLERKGATWRIVELAPPEAGLAPAVTVASTTAGPRRSVTAGSDAASGTASPADQRRE